MNTKTQIHLNIEADADLISFFLPLLNKGFDICITGKEDPQCIGYQLSGLSQKINSFHAWHALIRDYESNIFIIPDNINSLQFSSLCNHRYTLVKGILQFLLISDADIGFSFVASRIFLAFFEPIIFMILTFESESTIFRRNSFTMLQKVSLAYRNFQVYQTPFQNFLQHYHYRQIDTRNTVSLSLWVQFA